MTGAVTEFDWREFEAVLFDLDGVVTPTAEIHEHAWGELFAGFNHRVEYAHDLSSCSRFTWEIAHNGHALDCVPDSCFAYHVGGPFRARNNFIASSVAVSLRVGGRGSLRPGPFRAHSCLLR